jgi:hypothetical protein
MLRRGIPCAQVRMALDSTGASMLAAHLFAFAVLSSFLICNHTASAQEASITDAHVTWYGVYQTSNDSFVEDKSSLAGKRIVSTGIVPPKINGDRIPAILNSRFGFGFSLSGVPAGGLVRIRYVRNFPAVGILNAKTGERHFNEQGEFRIGVDRKDLFVGYSFDEHDELVAGVWSFELWHGSRKLLEKSFTVYKP